MLKAMFQIGRYHAMMVAGHLAIGAFLALPAIVAAPTPLTTFLAGMGTGIALYGIVGWCVIGYGIHKFQKAFSNAATGVDD